MGKLKRNITLGKAKSINIFTSLLIFALVCSMGSLRYDIAALRYASYLSECLLIGYTLINSANSIKRTNSSVIIVAIIVVLNFLLSPYEHTYTMLLKLFGYLCCYHYGRTLALRYESVHVSNVLLFVLIFLPVITVALFDDSLIKNAFFVTPNTFVYTGLAMAAFFGVTNNEKSKVFIKSWVIVAFYVLICTSLGVVVAIGVTFLILNLKRNHLPYLLLGGIVLVFAIFYIDLPVFIRFRDVIAVWTSMTADDWKNLQDLNIHELGQQVDRVGEREDTTSSIWRLSQWSVLFTYYIRHFWLIPFGLGTGFSIDYTGLMPHNDFLLILTEFGVIIFYLFIKMIRWVYKSMKSEGMVIYFVLSMFLYHFTENLIHNFPQNAILYFVIGWCMCRLSKSTTITRYDNYPILNQTKINEDITDK